MGKIAHRINSAFDASSAWLSRPFELNLSKSAAAAAVFVLIAGLSLVQKDIAFYAAAVYLLCATVYAPKLGWILLIFIAPFQYLFAFDDTAFWRLQALLLISVALLGVAQLKNSWRPISPFSVTLLLLLVLVSLHCGPDVSMHERVRIVTFFLAWIGVFELTRTLSAIGPNMRVAPHTIALSALTAVLVSAIFSILAIPELIRDQVPYFNYFKDIPAISMRLQGIQDNPNGLARMIAPALLIVACLFLARPSRAFLALCLAILTWALAATGTKSVIFAVACALSFGGIFTLRERDERMSLMGMGILVVAVFGASIIWLMPLADKYSATKWSAIGIEQRLHNEMTAEVVLRVFGTGNSIKSRTSDSVLQELRLGGNVREMKSNGGSTTYAKANGSLANTGQRLRTWTAGYETLKSNFWWGIGYGNWPKEMQARTGFPFFSPHNAFLEIAGAYGIAGGILYLAIFGFAARNFLVLRRHRLEGWQKITFLWTSMYILTVLIYELADVASVTTVTMSGAWFWIALALQEAVVLSVRNSADGSTANPAAASASTLAH